LWLLRLLLPLCSCCEVPAWLAACLPACLLSSANAKKTIIVVNNNN